MHHIQMKILNKLLYVESSGYAAMRPAGVESNHFAYHLEQLMKDKLVIKDGKRYRLSQKGVDFVDRLSHATMTTRPQPFIDTAIDITTQDSGKTLLFQRNFHPYFHMVSLPAGKLHLDETVAEAAVRELQEKTGLTGIQLTHHGVIYVEALRQGVSLGKKMYHVFHGEVSAELPVTAPPHRGTCLWADPATLPDTACMPGFRAMKAHLSASDSFFFDEVAEEVPLLSDPEDPAPETTR